MIIEIEPGERVRIPENSDIQVRLESPFSGSELDEPGVEIALEYLGFNGAQSEITGTHSGSVIVFLITAGLFTSKGDWTINPRVKASGYTRHWPEPAILEVGNNLHQRRDCDC
jgi:hypothetical protein